MNEFTTLAYLLSFPGMIAAVIMLTQFTKGMIDSLFTVKTKFVVFFYAFIFCVVAAMFQGDFTSPPAILSTLIVWFVNSVIIWFASMKAFEEVIQNKSNDPDEGV